MAGGPGRMARQGKGGSMIEFYRLTASGPVVVATKDGPRLTGDVARVARLMEQFGDLPDAEWPRMLRGKYFFAVEAVPGAETTAGLREQVGKHLAGSEHDHDQRAHAGEPHYEPEEWKRDLYQPKTAGRQVVLYQGSTQKALAGVSVFGLLSRDKQRELLGRANPHGVGYGVRDMMDISVDYDPDQFVHVARSREQAAYWAVAATQEQYSFAPIQGLTAIVFEFEVPAETKLYRDPASDGELIAHQVPPEWITGYYVVEQAWKPDPRGGRHARTSYHKFSQRQPLRKATSATYYAAMVVVHA